MTKWNDFDYDPNRAKWDNWVINKRKKAVHTVNAVSALCFALAALVEVSGPIIA